MSDTPYSQKWQDEQALFRFQTISPLLDAELDVKKRNAMRQQIAQDKDVSVRTLYRWEKLHAAGGFSALKPANRAQRRSAKLPKNFSEVLHDRVKLSDIPKMTDRDYTVRGCTALIDAIGGAIHHIGNVHKYARSEDVPEHTMFVIMTDGLENASRRYSSDEVKRMIEHEKEKYGWEFLFIGANIDSVETARHFGIGADRSVNYHADHQGTAVAFDTVCETVCNFRNSRPLAASWSDRINMDYNSRK